MAKRMAKQTKRVRNKTIFFCHQSQIKDSGKFLKKNYSYVNRYRRLKGYYHRLNIIEEPTYNCGGGSQTGHDFLYDCKQYKNETTQLRDIITKDGDRRSINKNHLVKKIVQ